MNRNRTSKICAPGFNLLAMIIKNRASASAVTYNGASGETDLLAGKQEMYERLLSVL